MQTQLQPRFDAIEQQRAALQDAARTLSDAQLNWTPNETTWSVRQIVEHLVLSDETVGRAQDAVETEPAMFRVVPRAVRRALVLRALNRDTVLPLPSPGVEPAENAPLPALLTRWQAAREQMRRALDALQGNETPYFHPVLGPLTGVQMLELSQTHIAYHTRQIERLQRSPAFSAKTETG